MSMTDSLTYCAREVRRLDHERYLAALFAPDTARPALMALYAFNIEIAKIAEIVSEPLLGRIRLQWWREAIAEIYDGGGREHAVIEALAQAVCEHRLSRARLDRMIDARALDLEQTAFPDIAALEAYVAGTAGALCELTLEALGAADEAALTAAGHAGLAWGLTGLLRALPHHAAQRRLYMPKDLLERAEITPEQIFARAPPAALPEIVGPVATAARGHLVEANRVEANRNRDRRARAVFLPLALTKIYLDRLERRGFDVFAHGLEPSALARLMRLTWAAFRARR